MKIKTSYIIMIVVGILLLSTILMYNSIIDKQENIGKSWSQVENVYQRRSDLIPNLVRTVKGYAKHEKETFTAVVEARAKATSININANKLNPQTVNNFMAAQDGLSSALSKLMVVVEKYPDLKANQNFLELQSQLEGTENRITTERRKFIENVKKYNTIIRKFPGSLFAGIFGFERVDYFQAEKGAEKAEDIDM